MPHVELARAKINLALHVLGRRPDGYHELDSIVAFADIADRLTFTEAGDWGLDIVGPFAQGLPNGPDNLVLKAAHRFAVTYPDLSRAYRITLEKNLPVASGIGGGSADAAATLLALSRLWDGAQEAAGLEAIAATLGADVPACLRCTSSFGGGTGAELVDAPRLPAAGVVLVNPGIALSTPEVFGRRRGAFSSPARFTDPPADARALADLLRIRRNDLTPGAVERAPVIAATLVALERSPGCRLARMSGSGATCFALFDDAMAAEAAAAALRAEHTRWWIAATRLVGARPIDPA